MKSADLRHRVQQFRAVGLPQQPPQLHKGTVFLVEDLVLEIERLEEEIERFERENAALREQLSKARNG